MKHFEFGKKEPGKGSDGGKKELKKKTKQKDTELNYVKSIS